MTRRFERAFAAPVPHPNGLQATEEGLWIADQDAGRALLVDIETGEVIRSLCTSAGKASGIGYGHGALWMCSNGMPSTRPPTPDDTERTRIVKTDPMTGAPLAQIWVPDDSDVHGVQWTPDGLWLTTLDQQSLTLVDAESFAPRRSFRVPLQRAHGLAWDGQSLWCAFTTDRIVLQFDATDGSGLKRIDLSEEPLEPHGLTMWEERLWICDATTGEVHRELRPA